MKTGSTTRPIATTGVAGLDAVLMGGLPRDRLYLVQGNPGAGKTTLALQFLLEGRREGEIGLYITLSETESELRAVAESHGWSLDGLSLFELQSASMDLTADAQQTVFHSAELELTEAMQPLLDHVARVKPSRVVFDSLSEIRLLAQHPLRYRRQILALKQFFIGTRCTVLLLDDLTSEPGDQQLESLAHGVITLEQLAPLYGTDRRRLRVTKLRGVQYRSGFHDFTIERGGLRVYPRLVAAEHRGPIERAMISSGIPALDELLGGGLDAGTSTLLTGPPGSGKSALASRYAFSMAEQGRHAAIFTFEESMAALLSRSDGLGMNMHEHIRAGRITVRQINPAELTPGEFVDLVRRSVEDDHARVVVIDSVNGYFNAMPEAHFLLSQLHELFMYLSAHGVVTLLGMAQHGLVGTQMSAPLDASYLADTIILLRYFESQGKLRKAISVVKKRSGAHGNMIREFSMGAKGIHIGEALCKFRGVLTGVPTFAPGDGISTETSDGGRND